MPPTNRAQLALLAILVSAGMTLVATGGTQDYLTKAGVACEYVNKVKEGRPHVVDLLINGEVQMVVNTTVGKQSILDSHSIRTETVRWGIPYFTTMAAAKVAARAMAECEVGAPLRVESLQQYHELTRR